jgi:glyceraldehyde 3-phosphate dehydrogenase
MEANFEQQLSKQTEQNKAAVEFIKIVNNLWYENSVELVIFRNQLIDKNISQVLRLHQYAGDFVGKPISIFNTLEIAKAIVELNMFPSRLDIGKLSYEFELEGSNFPDAKSFVSNQLKDAKEIVIHPKDVILYGFGRIGRLLARELITTAGKGSQLRLRAIVTRDAIDQKSLEKRASLLQNDTVHGEFPGIVTADLANEALIINGMMVKIISAKTPDSIDYTQYGINDALVIDNTGVFRDKEALSLHLKSNGVAKVLLTAPGKEVPNIVQ